VQFDFVYDRGFALPFRKEASILRQFSTSLRVLTILGVLLHAGLLVWHNTAMLGAKLQGDALASALGEICYGSGMMQRAASGDLPDAPPPASDQGNCPICKGCVSAVAILAAPELAVHKPDQTSLRIIVVGKVIAQRLARLRPPARGPPLTA